MSNSSDAATTRATEQTEQPDQATEINQQDIQGGAAQSAASGPEMSEGTAQQQSGASNTQATGAQAAAAEPQREQQQEQQRSTGITEAPGTDPRSDDSARMAEEPKPDVSDQDFSELLPKVLSYFHNNREELARALGMHRSTVDRWISGKSKPNNSTVLRMRRVAQERRIQ